jgi:hypothetical protein
MSFAEAGVAAIPANNTRAPMMDGRIVRLPVTCLVRSLIASFQ